MTKIPSTQELIKLVYSPDVSFDDMLEAAIDIHRTALLTELTERIKDMERVFDGCELADHDKSYLAALDDFQAHINNLINPNK